VEKVKELQLFRNRYEESQRSKKLKDCNPLITVCLPFFQCIHLAVWRPIM